MVSKCPGDDVVLPAFERNAQGAIGEKLATQLGVDQWSEWIGCEQYKCAVLAQG